jgi:excisionase family DNA binding protein
MPFDQNQSGLTATPDQTRKKPVGRVTMPPEHRLLVDRRDAAQYLSISQRSLDYLVANGELNVRKMGARVLIPISELQRYARVDHKRLVG